jgi:hypothetical protein
MANRKLSRGVQKVVGYPPLLDMSTCPEAANARG